MFLFSLENIHLLHEKEERVLVTVMAEARGKYYLTRGPLIFLVQQLLSRAAVLNLWAATPLRVEQPFHRVV